MLAKGDLVPLNCLLSPSALCYLFQILKKKIVNELLFRWWGREHLETWERIVSLSFSWVRLLGGGSFSSALLVSCRLNLEPCISPFLFPSNSTVVSGAVVSTTGLLPPVWSFEEVFRGWSADKLAFS